jgi:UDP-N-acetylmuramate dehydrogenase
MTIEREADLKPYNTFGVPVRAAALAGFTSDDELRSLLCSPELSGLDRLILGGGSNMLFTRDWPGVVLRNDVPGIEVLSEDADRVTVRAGAGVVWHDLVMHAVAQGWGGLENMSLIPGRVGAGPMQNIGAYGAELKDTFDHLEAVRTSDGEVVRFNKAECRFGYRESYFKREGKDRFVIMRVAFTLNKQPEVNVGYGSIKSELEKRGISTPTIKDVSDAVIAIRSSKLPDFKVLGNAGSFFKNPSVPASEVERIKTILPDLVSFPSNDGWVKLAAGQLIEKAGWKGFREHGYGVHKDQALVLVNHGGATGGQLYELSTRVLESVRERLSLEPEREVNIPRSVGTPSGSVLRADPLARIAGPAHLSALFAMLRSTPILLVLIGVVLAAACRKDPPIEEVAEGTPTPFQFTLPVGLDTLLIPQMVPADNPTTLEGIALGRRLFYERALSDDSTQSCATCHVQAHGFSDPLPFSVGTNGAMGTRNAMAVINLAWDDRFFWDGRTYGLEGQAHDPVVNPLEMRNTWPEVVSRLQADATYLDGFEAAFGTRTVDSLLVTKAIAQFERSLISFGSRFDRYEYMGDSSALSEQELRGRDLFMRDAKCNICHRAPLFFDHAFRNNGLDAVAQDGGLGVSTGIPSDWGRFKVPTLRNIAVTAPYMHDSRFNTLEEVVQFYAHEVHTGNPDLDVHMGAWTLGQVNLTEADESDLAAFLRALTDSTFLTDPALGAP